MKVNEVKQLFEIYAFDLCSQVMTAVKVWRFSYRDGRMFCDLVPAPAAVDDLETEISQNLQQFSTGGIGTGRQAGKLPQQGINIFHP